MPRGTQDASPRRSLDRYGTLTLGGRTFQSVRVALAQFSPGPTTPIVSYETIGLGSSRFARHYYGNLG